MATAIGRATGPCPAQLTDRCPPAGAEHAARIGQQLELLARTVEENAEMLAELRAAMGGSRVGSLARAGEIATAQAESVAALRRARLAIRAQTEAVRGLTSAFPPG